MGSVAGFCVSANPMGAVVGLDCNYAQLTPEEIRSLIMLLERAYWYRWQDEAGEDL